MPSTHIFRRRRFARPFQWGSMDQLTPRRTRLQSDSGAETVMSSDVSRSPDSGVFYGDLRDGRNMGSCDFMDDNNKVAYQNSPLSSKLTSPTKIQYHMENDDGYSSKSRSTFLFFVNCAYVYMHIYIIINFFLIDLNLILNRYVKCP